MTGPTDTDEGPLAGTGNAATGSSDPTRVLIVEDDEAMSVALRDGFEFEGYRVTVAPDGETGLRLAAGGDPCPDLVILDVMLPKKSGLDVCKELRAEAVLRRSDGRVAERESPESYRFGEVDIDFKHHEATRGGEPLELSPREFELLSFFIQHRGEVVTRERLLDAVWGYNTIPFTRTVDMHVAKLRKKIEKDPSDPSHIVTVHRLGYKFTG